MSLKHPREIRDFDDIRQRTGRVRQKLLSLLLDAAPQTERQESKSKRRLSLQNSQPAMREWTENRLADLDLWTAGISVLNRPGVFYALNLIKPTIASLLMLLGSLLDACHSLVLQDMQLHDHDGNEDDDDNYSSESDSHSSFDSDTGYLSPWSGESRVSSEDGESSDSREDDESRNSREDNESRDPGESNEDRDPSEDDAGVELRVATATEGRTVGIDMESRALLESMAGAESVLSQLIRLILRVRQSAAIIEPGKGDTTPDDKKQIVLRQELNTKLLMNRTLVGTQTVISDRTWDGLSKVQIRLIDSVLRRWNNFKDVRGSYPIAAESTTNEEIDRTARKLARIISKKAPDTMFQPGQSSTQTDLEPDLTQMFAKSGALHYFEALKVVNNGMLVWQCPCCARVFSESYVEDSHRWREHIDRDLLPYVCPVEACNFPDICYGSAEEWKSHLTQNHTQHTYWRCPACSERTETSYQFRLHIQQNHENIVDMDLWDDFAGSCKQSELVPLCCPVCVDRNECALDDIGEHIHDFSLLSLAQHIVLEAELKKNEPEPDASKAPLRFTDAIGRTSNLPWYAAKTWKDMDNLIRQAFVNIGQLGPQVARGHYRLLGPNGETILPRVWDHTVQPGWHIKMQLWSLPPGPVEQTDNGDVSGSPPNTHVPPIAFNPVELIDPVVGVSGLPLRPPLPAPPVVLGYSDDLDDPVIEVIDDIPATRRGGSSKRKQGPAHDSKSVASDLQTPEPRTNQSPAFTRWMLGGGRAGSKKKSAGKRASSKPPQLSPRRDVPIDI